MNKRVWAARGVTAVWLLLFPVIGMVILCCIRLAKFEPQPISLVIRLFPILTYLYCMFPRWKLPPEHPTKASKKSSNRAIFLLILACTGLIMTHVSYLYSFQKGLLEQPDRWIDLAMSVGGALMACTGIYYGRQSQQPSELAIA